MEPDYQTFADMIQAVFALLVLFTTMRCGIRQSLGLGPCGHSKTHQWNSVTPEVLHLIGWGVVWISLSVELSSQPKYCTKRDGSRLWTEPCNTLYAAYALSIFLWMLFCISFGYVMLVMLRKAVDKLRERQTSEKPNVWIRDTNSRISKSIY